MENWQKMFHLHIDEIKQITESFLVEFSQCPDRWMSYLRQRSKKFALKIDEPSLSGKEK